MAASPDDNSVPQATPGGTPGLRQRLASLGDAQFSLPRYVIVLVIILVVAFDLRMQSVVHSSVDTPIRADAAEYFLYAHNLLNYGTYSRTDTLSGNPPPTPVPDAKRAPLYPLFLTAFLDQPPRAANLVSITRSQAALSALAVLVVFWLCRAILPLPFALAATALTALSPHLVTMNIYVLSETLFGLLLVISLLVIVHAVRTRSVLLAGLGGLLLAAASLAHPMLLYFVVPLALLLLLMRKEGPSWKPVLVMVVGFALLQGVWVARNLITLGTPGDGTLMRAQLRTGVYPDLMYQGNPASLGIPYRYDPTFEQTSASMSDVLSEIARTFQEAPLGQARWYLLGKPTMAWSWDIIAGQGDVFVYPVLSSPYHYLPHFKLTHATMHALHWPLVILMAGSVILVWLPRAHKYLSPEALLGARVISTLLIYHVAVIAVGFPEPRYSVPIRPLMYLMAMVPLVFAYRWCRDRRLCQPSTEPTNHASQDKQPG